MKKILLFTLFLILINQQAVFSQPASDTVVYLLTCGPGTETYSVYGHSALRVVIADQKKDIVYNWGVFDFSTPNFAWKFAKGRLDYMLAAESLNSFLQGYFYEKRFVLSQKINLDAAETKKLLTLIDENIKPENVKYRYDFFYDDCSTRIRDLIENAIGSKLLYPPAETGKRPTFRAMVGKYQASFPWLNFGINLIMGSPGDKKALWRDRMFLPIDMKNGLSEAVVNRSGKMIPLLRNPDVLLDFEGASVKQNFLTSPVVVFTLLMIFIIIISSFMSTRRANNITDIIIYSVFSVLSFLMIFFNFFTDHQQMKWNLNILWLNPLIPICLILIILNKKETFWFRILFFITTAFLVVHFILPQAFNVAFLPLMIILLVRSSVRSGLDWNPLSLKII